MTLQINIGGKDRGIKFTMLSQELFEEKVSIFKKLPGPTKMQYAIMWAGLCGYLDAKEEEIDFTYEDVQEWVDEMKVNKRTEDFDKINTAFNDSVAFKNRIQEIEDWANKVRSLTEDETPAPKKKVKSISNGSPSISSPLVISD